MKSLLTILIVCALVSCTKRDLPGIHHLMKDWKSTPVLLGNVVYMNFESYGLSEKHIAAVLLEVQKDFSQFENLSFTLRKHDFLKRPVGQRQEVQIADSMPPYSDIWTVTLPSGEVITSNPAGLAVVGSMFRPQWEEWSAKVFTHKLHYNTKRIAAVVSHEIGHAMGLQHYPNSMGSAIMSEGKIWEESANWAKGLTVYKEFQNDTAIINTNLRRAPSAVTAITDRLTRRVIPVRCIR